MTSALHASASPLPDRPAPDPAAPAQPARPAARRSRLTRTAAAVAGLSLVLAACSSDPGTKVQTGVDGTSPSAGADPSDGASSAAPSTDGIEADLLPFYEQTVEWSDCGSGFECADIEVPFDWDDPAADTVTLGAKRYLSSGERKGTVLINPGGPGGSGVEFVQYVPFIFGKPLLEEFDVLGFDPRGVGESSPVACLSDAERDVSDAKTYTSDDAGLAEMQADAKAFGEKCLENTGPVLGEVDTQSSARDMDVIRHVVGDAQLNYLGFSYGTQLGATYAGLYPENVGRMVLDGATDPSASAFDVGLAQTTGFRTSFESYMAACLAGSGCPFRGSVDEGERTVSALLDRLDQSPLRAADGLELDGQVMRSAIDSALYSEQQWPELTTAFTEALRGESATAFALADSYFGRSPDGTYTGNFYEAFLAIQCIDYPVERDPSVLVTEAAEIRAAAGELADDDTSRDGEPDPLCGNWPYAAKQAPAPVSAEGAAPIVVVGTTGDPATPYSWAEALAGQLSSGVLLTYEGEGHIAYD